MFQLLIDGKPNDSGEQVGGFERKQKISIHDDIFLSLSPVTI
jgi:hypothetical protein